MSKRKFSAIGPHHDTVQFDIVAMVSSAGGLAAVRHVLEHLPAAFPAAIVIVQHLDPRHRSLMGSALLAACLLSTSGAHAELDRRSLILLGRSVLRIEAEGEGS